MMQSACATPDPRQRKGRRMLLLLLVLFALPVAIVLFMYGSGWRPAGASHGELLRPPLALTLPQLRDVQGRDFGPEQWRDRWHLVYAGRTCDAACLAQVHVLRQVHVALNKEMDRMQRVLLLREAPSAGTLVNLRQRDPALVILSGAEAQPLAAQFTPASGPDGGVYLVDPLGNLMMRYPAGYEPKGLLHDLQRLLRYSWVG